MERLTSGTRVFSDSEKQAFYNMLREYEDMEENGMLLKLRCKKGDPVYFTESAFSHIFDYPIKAPVSSAVESIEVKDDKVWYTAFTDNKMVIRSFNNSEIGKSVFLDKDQAKADVEKRKNDYEQSKMVR